jgi:UDP-N-acetylmuramoylalanine-D-glutamate ligase
MIEHVLRKLKISCIACGNNGLPPLTITQSNYEYIILKISSYQLEYMNNFKSFITLLTNVTPDHLERHDTFTNYLMINKNIFNDSDHCIANIKLKNQLDIKKMSYYGYEPNSNEYYINNIIRKKLLITDKLHKCNSTKLHYNGGHII